LMLAAVSIGQLSKHMPTAGSCYTYVSNGLHPAVDFLVGWGFLLGILAFIGFEGSYRLPSQRATPMLTTSCATRASIGETRGKAPYWDGSSRIRPMENIVRVEDLFHCPSRCRTPDQRP